MTPFDLFGYKLDGERMQATGSVLVMILVPLLTYGVYPLLERFGVRPTPLRRMSSGMVLAAFSFVIVGFLQARLEASATLSVAWQFAPYIVIEVGEVMLSATALEFAFGEAPSSMKSTIVSFWYVTNSIGNLLVAVITKLNDQFVGAKGAAQFYFYALLMFAVSGIFIWSASRYHTRREATT
jgi:POT family proton-dependent oligopeptide transporter